MVPSAIHWPDGNIGGLGKDWWRPENHSPHDPLYVWPSAMGHMLDTLHLAYHMTQDAKYLEPLLSIAQVRLDYLRTGPQDPVEPGSRAWCGRYGGITSVAGKHKLVLGGDDFDELLAAEMGAYVKARLSGDFSGLTRALEETARALSVNYPGYTSEVRYSDRVLRFPHVLQRNGMFAEPPTEILIPQPRVLYATVTGDHTRTRPAIPSSR